MVRSILLFLVVLLASTVTHAQETITVAGSYKGKLPCEECDIIECDLELKYGTDSTGEFSLRDKYVSKGGTNVSSRITGEWLVTKDVFEDRKVVMVILNYDNEDKAIYYILKADGNLQPLDKEKRKITSDIDCTLKKML